MCFSAKSSFTAWGISLVIAFFLYQRNQNYDRWNAAFLATFTLIQLLEGGLWSNGFGSESDDTGDKNGEINSILTKLVLVALLVQPFVQSFAGWKTTGEPTLAATSLIFFVIVLFGVWRVLTANPGQFSTKVGEKGHLVWEDSKNPNSFIGGWVIGVAYLVGLFLPLYFMSESGSGSASERYPPGLWLFAVGIITALYALFKAGPNEFSSMWCITSVIYGAVAVFV